ncbi:MAG: hypothetical protein IJ344_04840 [Clostridia bacterium]|nr:hypothetical protein [Clostridia bacterium]
MRIWKYFIAVLCIALAILGLAEATGLLTLVESIVGELSLWRVAFALFFLVYAIYHFVKRNVFWGIISLAVLFLHLESNIAHLCGVASGNLISNGTFLLCAGLIGFGLHLLLPGPRKGSLFWPF